MQLRAGTSGFSYAEWRGGFYPRDLSGGEMLAYYSRRLPAVEINNTFYRMPKADVLAAWRDAVGPDFRFVLKAPRRITHISRLVDAGDAVGFLLGAARSLGEKLGPILFQLPPFMKKDAALLRDFLATLPDGCRAAFEFRHASWYADEIYAALGEKNAALCLGDAEDEARSPPAVATANFGYLRLRRASYDTARIGEWLDVIRAQRWTEAYAFFKHELLGPLYAEQLDARFYGRQGPESLEGYGSAESPPAPKPARTRRSRAKPKS